MIIERGSEKRYAEVLQIVKNFYQEALKEYGTQIDEATLLNNFAKYQKDSFLLIIDGKCEGLIAGVEVRDPLNNAKVYQEIIWYVNEPHRKYGVFLLNKTLEILKTEGYTSMVMALMHNSKTEKIGKLYERMGFKPFETHYLRNL